MIGIYPAVPTMVLISIYFFSFNIVKCLCKSVLWVSTYIESIKKHFFHTKHFGLNYPIYFTILAPYGKKRSKILEYHRKDRPPARSYAVDTKRFIPYCKFAAHPPSIILRIRTMYSMEKEDNKSVRINYRYAS